MHVLTELALHTIRFGNGALQQKLKAAACMSGLMPNVLLTHLSVFVYTFDSREVQAGHDQAQ